MFAEYRKWLQLNQKADKQFDNSLPQNTLLNTFKTSAAYQEGALRNGEIQPMIVTRVETKKSKFTIIPGDTMFIGDLIEVFNEKWLCMELYTDEYGITSGELWMCNHIFTYQDFNYNVINKPAIIDDGSYSDSKNKSINTVDNSYECYVSLDKESEPLHIDKRLSLGTFYDSRGNKILEVGKIAWLDRKTNNFGEGSHLLSFGIADDVYNKERDNIELLICDYVDAQNEVDDVNITDTLVINGNSKIRIGTTREYDVSAIDNGETKTDITNVLWRITDNANSIKLTQYGNKCKISVDLDDSIIGHSFKITCEDKDGRYSPTSKEVVVITIG